MDVMDDEDDDGDEDREPSDASRSDGIHTPISGSPRSTPVSTSVEERPTGAVSTQLSSTPGRDGE